MKASINYNAERSIARTKDKRMSLGDFLSPSATEKPSAGQIQVKSEADDDVDDGSVDHDSGNDDAFFFIKGRNALGAVGVRDGYSHSSHEHEYVHSSADLCESVSPPISTVVVESSPESASRHTPKPSSRLEPTEHIASLEARLSTLEKLVRL